MKYFLFILCLGFCIGLNAQFYFRDSLCRVYNQRTIKVQKLPYIINPKNTIAQDNINRDLFDNYYNGYMATDTIPVDGAFFVHGSTINYSSERIISFTFDAEGCGAYCETFKEYFNYSSITGTPITIDSLFTEKGRTKLANSLRLKRTRIIKDHIKLLKDSTNQKLKDQQEPDLHNDQIEMYTKCLEENNPFYLSDFRVEKKQLIFYSTRCSAHWNRAFDELGNIPIPVKIKDLKKYLTPYGKKLLL